MFTTALSTYSQYEVGIHRFVGITSLLDFSLKQSGIYGVRSHSVTSVSTAELCQIFLPPTLSEQRGQGPVGI